MSTAVYGIRHHGPGSARSVRAALAEQRPDVVLIEGPPEADELVGLAADPQMRPPVALLGYVPGVRLNVGVATVPVIVYVTDATALSLQPLSYAIALIVVVLATAMVALYSVPVLEVGVVPSVV